MKKRSVPRPSFDPTSRIIVRGATAPSGVPYIQVSACGRSAWALLSAWRRGGTAAEDVLIANNIVLVGDQWKRCLARVHNVTKFPARALIEQPGWISCYFALPDGSVTVPRRKHVSPVVLYPVVEGRFREQGTIDDWLSTVAAPLSGQQLAKFVIMAMFAAPLLRLVNRAGNFGFELAGPKGVGKSTLQFLAASVVGPALSRSGVNYWRSANATAAGLERVMAEHSDLPLVIEETNLFAAGESGRNRAAKFDEFVFRLSDGSVKARYQDHAQQRFRFIYVTSTNEPLDQTLGSHRAVVSDAAADRLLTLPIGTRPHGVFDFVPKGYADAAAFAQALTRGASRHFGTAMRTFLQGLVDARYEDAAGLRAAIERSLAKFRKAVGVDLNSGSATRVADAFGLVYAAGRLAKQFGALPAKWNCLKPARVAYELNRSTVSPLSYRERILSISRGKGALDLSKHPQPRDADIENATALVNVGRRGRRELLFTHSALAKAFADPRTLFRDPEVKRLMVTDEGRKTVKRRLRAGRKPERVYCFILPRRRSS